MAQQEQCAPSDAWARVKSRLRAELGEDVFASWFRGVEVERVDEEVVHLTVATRFLRNWLRSHYYEFVLRLSRGEWPTVERVEFRVRQPHFGIEAPKEPLRQRRGPTVVEAAPEAMPLPMPLRTGYGGFEGSPLDPRLSFTSFMVGASNRLAHAAAQEVAGAFSTPQPLFNPLFMHGNVGLGKTHLLHAISWDVKQRKPEAQVLYLTAERFMSGFVQALRARDALAFKEKLRKIDILLIDDMEFLQGPTIQQEFCHTLNSLIDGGRQVVVAADRAPTQLDKLDMRMRSRLGGGLVAEIGAMDYELRHKILQKRANEACIETKGLDISDTVLAFLSERLTESGRELEGAVHRLRASYQLTDEPVTLETAEQIVRDLMRGAEPRRVRIDDILRTVSKHYGVNRGDLLSGRRNRSIVRPRQIGMYLAKLLTSRSLPEIGRRFGNRDHTTVLHAIRKIEQLMNDDNQLREEIELLKRLLRD
ncbi:MAG TPA: chromosomal replication initiator protein DnaA [Rhizobiales bacterium]|nr:chromosomal replication initiator protein DnaA [Hyphomicrobiales bacterium]HAN63771.1 chromosomal replication initiator protein DnaA [Hyphomicrobiales bacterium]HBH42021.1 chromosomal replication initiator protein DnaA [Hyphomicrobiales bacterium]HBR25598.1 chromosomal replication initiator protein DnaA [Hyphomicrobiales bacterium]HCL63213.1 chromosomal replication initiator protein DnaA [Hyphomicrobiales bacterium]